MIFHDKIKIRYYNIEHPTGVTKNGKLAENLFNTIRIIYVSKGLCKVASFRDIDGTLEMLLDSKAERLDNTKNIYQLCKTLNSKSCNFCNSKVTIKAIVDSEHTIYYCKKCNQAFKEDHIKWESRE